MHSCYFFFDQGAEGIRIDNFPRNAAISKHISNIYAVGELDPLATVSKMETVVNRGFRGVVTDWIVCTFDAELGFLIQIYPIMKILGRKSTKIINFRP